MSHHQSMTGTFTAANEKTDRFILRPTEEATVTLTFTGTASVVLAEVLGDGAAYRTIREWTATPAVYTHKNTGNQTQYLVLLAKSVGSGSSVAYTLSDVSGDQVLQEWRAADGTLAFRITDEGPQSAVGPQIDVRAFGAVGDGVADDTVAIQAAFDRAETGEQTVYFPPGNYRTTAALNKPVGVDLLFARGATIVADAEMDAVIQTSATVRDDSFSISGGTLDCASLADRGLWMRFVARATIRDVDVYRPMLAGFALGSSTASGTSYGCLTANLEVYRDNDSDIPVGSTGMLVENGGDHRIEECVFIACDTGLTLDSNNNVIAGVHVWGRPRNSTFSNTGIDNNGRGNVFVQCYLDTLKVRGIRQRLNNGVYVACKFYVNDLSPYDSDDEMVGIYFDQADPYFTSSANHFYGQAADHRVKQDFEYTGGLDNASITGSQHVNVVTTTAARQRGNFTVTGSMTSGSLNSTGAAETASRGTFLRTDGSLRAAFRLDTAAESGANAGSGLILKMFADDGIAETAEPIYVERATGNMRMNRGTVAFAGEWEIPVLFGVYRLWVDGGGLLRIKNGTPSSDTDGTVVGTQS